MIDGPVTKPHAGTILWDEHGEALLSPKYSPLQPNTEHPLTAIAEDPEAQRPVWEIPATHLPIEQSFRHGWWSSRRRRVYDALYASGAHSRRLVNFQHCGSMASVEVHNETGQVRVVSTKCHDRMCQACGEERARKIARVLQVQCEKQKTLHVVLTLASTDADLGKCMDRLYSCFSKLRAGQFWKDNVAGGAHSFEATWNANTKQWHPHLHVLVHSAWLDQNQLRSEWQRVTGDSHIVHVSLVHRGTSAAREVTKYIGKPIHRSVDGSQALILELIEHLAGRRMISTFGTWRGLMLTVDSRTETLPSYVKPSVQPPSPWRRVCSLIECHKRASNGDVWSIQTLRFLASHRPGREHTPPPTAPAPPPDSTPALPDSG